MPWAGRWSLRRWRGRTRVRRKWRSTESAGATSAVRRRRTRRRSALWKWSVRSTSVRAVDESPCRWIFGWAWWRGRTRRHVARILTRAIAVMTEEDAAGFLAEVGTAALSQATLSRLPRVIAARYEMQREVIESALRARDVLPEATVTVQAGLDGVMVPQDGEEARPRGRKTDSPEPPRHEQRYGVVGAPGPRAEDRTKGRAWHEGAVATLAFFDADGRRLKTTYIARMPEAHKATTVAMLEKELHAVLQERPDVDLVLASDGAAAQWAALEGIQARLPPELHQGRTMMLADAFHVAEYLTKAANAIEDNDSPEARILAATWRETIKEKDGGADTVLRSMRARLPSVEAAARCKEVENAIGYIHNQNDAGRLDYAEAGRRHYPIGTGVTEAAAKTIVGTRMKRAGARFSQHGGQTVMTFRAALLSNRFDALHQELHATYTKSVMIAA